MITTKVEQNKEPVRLEFCLDKDLCMYNHTEGIASFERSSIY